MAEEWTVLVIDDSLAVRRAVALMLSGGVYRVLEAADGAAALTILETESVDVVVTDLNMPVLDGYGVIKAMRAMPAYKFVPVLVLTTECRDDVISSLKRSGVTGVLQKPIERDGLTAALERCLG
jgi:two-component system chemotaxis response regulator CheY